jgi:hypothetical protein|tara:strand:+ start:4783 stop:4965 length:183 start_codon:yes stop_codon:yes gene_type:complete
MPDLNTTKAPNLVIPTIDYSQSNQNQFTNQLRIYFNSVDESTIKQNTAVMSNNVLYWIGS